MLFIAVLLRTLLISHRGDETLNTHSPSHDGLDGWMEIAIEWAIGILNPQPSTRIWIKLTDSNLSLLMSPSIFNTTLHVSAS